MVKTCSVLSCESGRKNARKKNNVCNLRQISLFKIPKDPEKLRKWSSGLNQDLTANKFICELHFSNDDIIKRDTVELFNSDIFVSDRKKYTLKPNAIPTIIKNNTSLERSDLPLNPNNNVSTLENSPPRTSKDETLVGSLDFHVEVSHQDTSASTPNLNYELPPDSLSENLSTEDTLIKLTIIELIEILRTKMLPEKWSWASDVKDCHKVYLFYADPKSLSLKFHVKIDEEFNITLTNIKTNKSTGISFDLLIVEDFWDLLKQLQSSVFCDGTGFDSERCSLSCVNILTDEKHQHYQGIIRCQSCRVLRRQLQNRQNKSTKDLKLQCNNLKQQLKLQKRKSARLQRKNIELYQLIDEQKLKCAAVETEVIEKAIADLPEVQQKAVRACFDCAKLKNSKLRRYDVEWVYECLLMRIKNSALYDRLRERQILPLPCKDTLNSYIQKLDSAFGFPKAIFETLAYRTSRMETYSKRGTLLIDEVALSEGVKLNSRTMKFDGFVDLGDHTPQKYLNTRADHALVFMFQQFQGDWVQVVGSFLSKNSVTSDILHKLITEYILLLEKAGLQVDCVTTDAAQWNRGAWKIFGIEDQKFSCEHPYDANRRLWFASDFCHLLKNFRNGIIKLPCFWTPDGIVKMLHWEVLLKLEAYGKMNMKIGFKLSPSHLKPEGFQK
ncbi:uncharacterized protein LOC141528336 isoform X1 [Cotesia typhae]|uniref:uncharacterized protein LOC141528336 isoform X1 n=1 Tax=Cotesia typhae TaxID=2053667 RepID=UPI003D68A5A4